MSLRMKTMLLGVLVALLQGCDASDRDAVRAGLASPTPPWPALNVHLVSVMFDSEMGIMTTTLQSEGTARRSVEKEGAVTESFARISKSDFDALVEAVRTMCMSDDAGGGAMHTPHGTLVRIQVVASNGACDRFYNSQSMPVLARQVLSAVEAIRSSVEWQ